MADKIISKEYWLRLAHEWAIGIPPWRPTDKEIDIYEDYLLKAVKNIKKPKMLILGATPELRDLTAKHKIATTIVDINPNMVAAMASILEISDGREKKLIANWLEIPLPAHQFDAILCDHGMHWIFFDEWDKFLKDKNRLLKKGGYFINSYVTVDKNEIMNVDDIVKVFKNNKFTREDKFYYVYRAMFGFNDAEGKLYYKDLGRYDKDLAKYVKRGVLNKKEFEFLKCPFGDVKCVNVPKEEVDKKLGQYFEIKSIKVNFEHPVFTCHKIYFLKAK